MGISTSTLYGWKKKYSEFSEALKRGKEIIDREVENALLKRALGYEYEEITQERIIRKDVKGDPMTDLHEKELDMLKKYQAFLKRKNK